MLVKHRERSVSSSAVPGDTHSSGRLAREVAASLSLLVMAGITSLLFCSGEVGPARSLADRPLGTLSGGQRQRARIAMAVAQDTAVLLLDEPTSALDLGHQLEIFELLRDLAVAGRTVVAVVHDLALTCRYAGHLIAMKAGQVMAEGTPYEVVTPHLIRRLHGVESSVLRDPVTDCPVVVPRGLTP